MKEKIKNLIQNNFVKDTFILQIGTFISTCLSFIGSIAFARYLGPENYGQYALIFAFTGLVGVFMQWGADIATLTLLAEAWIKGDKEEIKKLIIFFIKISLITTATVGLIVLIFAPLITQHLYQNPVIGNLARWVLLAIIIRFWFSFLIILLQASRKIKQLTLIENINKVIYILFPIALMLIVGNLSGIVWGHFLSAAIFFIFSIYFYRLIYKKTHLLPSLREILAGLKTVSIRQYLKFGFSIAIDKNLVNLYTFLPITFLGMFATTAEVGFFKIAFSYIGLSLMFLKPITRLLAVQLPQSKTRSLKILKKHFYKTTLYSTLGILIILIPMLFLSKYLVEIFYGIKYLPAVNIIYSIWPYALISALGVGLGALYRTLNKVKISIIINLINILIGLPIFYFLIKNYGLHGMIITTLTWFSLSVLAILIFTNLHLNKLIKSQIE